MSELWGKITGSFDKLKDKIKGVAANPTPSPLSSNAASIQGGGRRKRSGSKRSGSKRMRRHGGSKRQRSKKVRFSKKNKVYTYKRK